MSDTPETDEAVERWRQGKINIFDEMARLERERDTAIALYTLSLCAGDEQLIKEAMIPHPANPEP